MPQANGSLGNCYRLTMCGGIVIGFFRTEDEAYAFITSIYPTVQARGDFTVDKWFIEGEF